MLAAWNGSGEPPPGVRRLVICGCGDDLAPVADRAALEDGAQTRTSAMEARANGALGRREAGGDLVEPEILVIVKRDDVAVALRELFECLTNAGVALAGCRARLGALVVCSVVGCGEASQVFEVEAFDELGAVSPLRAHHHERLVRGHPEEPGREARIAAEGPHPPDDLHERRLYEVAPVLFGEGIPHQLFFYARLEQGHQRPQRRRVTAGSQFESRAVNREGHVPTLSVDEWCRAWRLPTARRAFVRLRSSCRRSRSRNR